ncbi:MAG: PAS domain-containing protein [Myxococcales bacterium]|nr:PAS domain-containing protein [Myxococcales bacterium]
MQAFHGAPLQSHGHEELERRIAELERENAALRRERVELGDREADLLAVLAHTPAPIYLKDADLKYILVNARYEQLAHCSLDVLRGKTDYDIFPEPVAQLFREQDREVMAQGAPREFEETIPLPDGEFTFITVKFPVHDGAGKLRAVGGLCTDITARKKAEQDREQLILQLQEAVAEVMTLRKILPICAWCKQIRDDKGYWTQLEAYLSQHSELEFTHSICPRCSDKVLDP